MTASLRAPFSMVVLHALHEARPDLAYSARKGKSASPSSADIVLKTVTWRDEKLAKKNDYGAL